MLRKDAALGPRPAIIMTISAYCYIFAPGAPCHILWPETGRVSLTVGNDAPYAHKEKHDGFSGRSFFTSSPSPIGRRSTGFVGKAGTLGL